MAEEGADESPKEPSVGEPLPAAGDASIDRDKLLRYGLSVDHPVGRHKATVFRLALDIERDDWEYLRDNHRVGDGRRPTRAGDDSRGSEASPTTGCLEVDWASAMARRARTLDTVKLTRDCEGWPVGTIGAVVSEYPETALVEVVTHAGADTNGLPRRDLFDDLVTVPYGALHVVEPAATHAR